MIEKERLLKLVTAAQSGDGDALNNLFTEYYNDVYYFALKTVKDPDLACDITQEAFIEIMNTLDKLKEPAAFVSWTRQITYHRCTKYFAKTRDLLVDEKEDGGTIFDDLREENRDFIPDEALDSAELKKIVLSIIDTLTPEQRSAVMMFYFDELSIKQIAEIQGVNENTVKSRLNYAKKAIKAAVEEFEKKNGVKLHAFPFLPFLFGIFGKEKETLIQPAEAVLEAVSSATAKGGAAVATGAAKAGLSLGAKIGIAAGAVVLGGGAVALATVALSAVILGGALFGGNDKTPDTESSAPITSEKQDSADGTSSEEPEKEEAGLIPLGGVYSVKLGFISTEELVGDGETVRFPEEPASGDCYVYGDYNYRAFTTEDGTVAWSAGVNDTTKAEYEPILESVCGAPVISLQNAFAYCENMVEAPVIPESIVDMLGCFQGCYSLETAPVIPKNVTNLAYAFEDCTSLKGIVTIHANPTETNNMWYGTAHPLYLTGNSDMLEEMTVSGLLGIFGEVYLLQDMPD